MGGKITMLFDGIVPACPRSKLDACARIAVTYGEALAGKPDIPTMAELGLAGSEVNSWTTALLAPAGYAARESSCALKLRSAHPRCAN